LIDSGLFDPGSLLLQPGDLNRDHISVMGSRQDWLNCPGV